MITFTITKEMSLDERNFKLWCEETLGCVGYDEEGLCDEESLIGYFMEDFYESYMNEYPTTEKTIYGLKNKKHALEVLNKMIEKVKKEEEEECEEDYEEDED